MFMMILQTAVPLGFSFTGKLRIKIGQFLIILLSGKKTPLTFSYNANPTHWNIGAQLPVIKIEKK